MNNTASQPYLTFLLNDARFAVHVTVIYEVLEFVRVTPVPNTPPFVLGVIDLRGNVLPLLDLRMKLELGTSSRTDKTRILILDIRESDDATVQAGVVVDAACDVVMINDDQIRPASDIDFHSGAIPVTGIVNDQGIITMILDINGILTQRDLTTSITS
jgi:purine-binding chemotaxis protein CheW